MVQIAFYCCRIFLLALANGIGHMHKLSGDRDTVIGFLWRLAHAQMPPCSPRKDRRQCIVRSSRVYRLQHYSYYYPLTAPSSHSLVSSPPSHLIYYLVIGTRSFAFYGAWRAQMPLAALAKIHDSALSIARECVGCNIVSVDSRHKSAHDFTCDRTLERLGHWN